MIEIPERLLKSYFANKESSKDSMIARMEKSFPNAECDITERKVLLERILNFIIAGYETTATTISWIFYLLANNPEYVDKLYDDVKNISLDCEDAYSQLETISLLDAVIKESMRIYPALWFNIRYCAKEHVINNTRFRKGDKIMLLPFISNHDASIYHEPGKFIPGRFEEGSAFSTFAFGHGPRLCAGKALAEMELKLIVAKFVQAFKFSPVNQPEPIGGVLLHPNEEIKIRVLKRNEGINDEK